MALTLDQFVERLTDSGLMSADEARGLIAGLPADQQAGNAEAFAKQLVTDKRLTPFQAEQVWKGEGKSLVLGDYVIRDKIGAGGMGMVYKASHRLMKREVALKVLPPAITKDPMATQRFLREVEAAAKLTHSHIVAAYDAGEANGAFYLIMEYVEGNDLSVLVKKQGATSIAQAVDFILQAARGLEYAHQNGVVHRDIKPANLLLDNSGTVKVLDMGLARIEDGGVDAATQAALTGTGTIMGTVDYMAPEQAEDTKSAGPQADIYSLGASLYYLLTGKSMVTGTAIGKKLKMLMTGVGLPDSIIGLRSEVSAEVDAIFQKMTAFEMAERYQTMTEVIAALESIKAGSETSSASNPGIQPVAGRSDDSAMQSFANKLGDDTADAAAPTVVASPQTEAAADTMASSVDEATRPGFKKTAKFATVVTEPKNRKLLIGGAAAACLLVGAIFWGLNRSRRDTPSADGLSDTPIISPRETTRDEPKTGQTSSVTRRAGAYVNYALEFDGYSSYVDTNLILDVDSPFTIELTIIPESLEKNRAIASSLRNTRNRPPGFSLALSGASLFFARNWRDQEPRVTTRSVLALGSAAHVAGVWDGKRLLIYVDGKQYTELGVEHDFDTVSSPASILLGSERNSDGPRWFFHGRIDEIRISSNARYTQGYLPRDSLEPDEHTLALYHCDEGDGTVLKDSSGNGHHGKIVEAKWVRVDASPSSDVFTRIDLPDGEPGEALRIPHNVIRHPNSNHLGFLSDKLVLTASTNGTPTTYRLRDGVPQRKLERAWFDDGKDGAIRFAQSSNHLFGGLSTGRACLWDIESGKIEKYFGEPAEATQENKTFALSVSPDGKSVAVAQPHGLERVWDVETGRQIGSRQMVLQARCAFLPGSQKLGLLSGTQLAIWDVANDQIEKTYPHGLPASTDFRISPDGRYAIACDGRRPAAFCLNLHTGDVRQFSSPDAPAYFATISPDSRWLYAGGILYDLETLQPALDLTQAANGDSDSSWRLVTYAPDGRFLVVHVYSEEKSKQGIVFWRLPEKFWPRGTRRDVSVPPPAVAPFDEAQAKAHQKAWADHLGQPVENQIALPGGEKMKFVLIPPGEFLMGTDESEIASLIEEGKTLKQEQWILDRYPKEGPVHRVTLAKPYAISAHEVTRGQFRQFVASTSYKTDAEKSGEGGTGLVDQAIVREPQFLWNSKLGFDEEQSDSHPVVNVSWNDASAFCEWLSEEEGVKYRLPTEAEWEFACRAGTTSRFCFGDDPSLLSQYAWHSKNGGNNTMSVGQKSPNAFGLFDMHGNVWEACLDNFVPYVNSPAIDPLAITNKASRVKRGGAFTFPPGLVRSASRSSNGGSDSSSLFDGFRVVCTFEKLDPGPEPTVNEQVPLPAKAPFNTAQAKAHQTAWAKHLDLPVEKEVELPGGAKMTFMLVPPGEFMMGATVSEQKLFLEQSKVADDGFVEYDRMISDKNSQHLVRITQPFYFGKYEVTQAEWESVMKTNPSRTKSPEHAVGRVAWNDVKPFLDKLNEEPTPADTRFALPTEAQWEYACRAGTTSSRHYGNSETELQEYGWFKANGSKDTHRVGQLRPNPFGLYDMYGNIYEWCADWYDVDYYANSPVNDPVGPATGQNRIVRGGSWNHPPRHCNSTHRGFDLPDKPFVDHGLRLVLTIDPSK